MAEKYLDQIIAMALQFAPKLALALVVLLVGFWIIAKVTFLLGKTLTRSQVGPEIRPFLQSLVSVGLKIMLLFSVAGMVGIETTSFIAVLAAAGFAIGMALQGSLGNFAAGVMILLFKPYRIKDLIRVGSETGYVQEIQIFDTIIVTLDHRRVIIPNSMTIGGVIVNLTAEQYLRIDLKVPLAYGESFETAREAILEVLHGIPQVLKDPAPFVGIAAFDSHQITLDVQPYAMTDDYWTVHYAALEGIRLALYEKGLHAPVPDEVSLAPFGPK